MPQECYIPISVWQRHQRGMVQAALALVLPPEFFSYGTRCVTFNAPSVSSFSSWHSLPAPLVV